MAIVLIKTDSTSVFGKHCEKEIKEMSFGASTHFKILCFDQTDNMFLASEYIENQKTKMKQLGYNNLLKRISRK